MSEKNVDNVVPCTCQLGENHQCDAFQGIAGTVVTGCHILSKEGYEIYKPLVGNEEESKNYCELCRMVLDKKITWAVVLEAVEDAMAYNSNE